MINELTYPRMEVKKMIIFFQKILTNFSNKSLERARLTVEDQLFFTVWSQPANSFTPLKYIFICSNDIRTRSDKTFCWLNRFDLLKEKQKMIFCFSKSFALIFYQFCGAVTRYWERINSFLPSGSNQRTHSRYWSTFFNATNIS